MTWQDSMRRISTSPGMGRLVYNVLHWTLHAHLAVLTVCVKAKAPNPQATCGLYERSYCMIVLYVVRTTFLPRGICLRLQIVPGAVRALDYIPPVVHDYWQCQRLTANNYAR